MGAVFLDSAEIARVLLGPDGPVTRHLLSLGRQVESRAKELCPVNFGRLRSSITTKPATDTEHEGTFVLVGSNVEYAIYVEMNDNARHTVGQAHYLTDALAELA